jgi:hypothetical protein
MQNAKAKVAKRQQRSGTRVNGIPIARNPPMPAARTPRLRSGPLGSIVENEELVADLSGSTSFAVSRLELNPGLPVFPWLQAIGGRYDKYRWKKLQIRYQPSNAVSTTPGTVFLAADMDPSDPTPASAGAMKAQRYQATGFVNEKVVLNVPIARMFDGVQWKKTRCGPRPMLQLFDGCVVFLGTDDCADTSDLGKIYIDYVVELVDPGIEDVLPLPPHRMMVGLSGDQTLTTNTITLVNFDTAVLEGFPLVETGGAITLPCGRYFVQSTLGGYDGTSEVLSLEGFIYKNGAALSPAVIAYAKQAATTSSGAIQVTFFGIVDSDGTDTLEIHSRMIGAAGTLKLRATYCYLSVVAL